jgi:diguanylate cyclase (GGDEF)-like protein/PAS domain S-box-containing protein
MTVVKSSIEGCSMAHDSSKRAIQPTDRVALIALGGIVVSAAAWAIFGWMETVVRGHMGLGMGIFAPDTSEALVRLSTVVVIMAATLVVEMLYTRRLRAEERVRLEQSRIRQIYDNSPDSIAAISPGYRVLYANSQCDQLAGAPTTDYLGARCHSSLWGSDSPCDSCPAGEVFATGQVVERTREDEAEGRRRWFEQVFFPVLDDRGSVGSVVESVRETTVVHNAELALRRSHQELEEQVAERTLELKESEERYRQLVESSPDMVLVHAHGRIVFLNSPGASLMGFASQEDAFGLPVSMLWVPVGAGMSPEELAETVHAGNLPKPTHVKLRREDGSLLDVELTASEMRYEGSPAVQCVVRDISERIRALETIERMAYYDPLTDLPNRTLFRDRLKSGLAQARRRKETVAVVFADLDDFKAINDSLGHAVGDGVLKAVADRLRDLMRGEDTIARYSGDEFTMIARVAGVEGARMLAERINEALGRGFQVEGYPLHVSASVGIATYPTDAEFAQDLIKMADAAMYKDKEDGHGQYRMYSSQIGESVAERLQMEAELRYALEADQFELYYQPQVDLRDGRLVGIEALLRWHHPTRGILSAGEFLELAERAGFMTDIGRWVLTAACEQMRSWQMQGLDFGRVAVNLSAREFVQRDIVDMVAAALASTGLEPDKLELEITETVAMYNLENIRAILRLLREKGVRIAIDDFGTGYSAMSYLRQLPVQTLKIAQEFMRDVNADSQSAAIVTMLIDLCQELGFDIVVEGVETQGQLEFLRKRGCYVIQGFLCSRPVGAAAFEELMRTGLPLAR